MPTPFAPTQATAAWPCPKPMQRAIACAKPRPAPPATIATASCSIGPGSRSPPVISTDALSVAQIVERDGDRLAGLGWLAADRQAELMELAAQGVDLVEQVDHRLHRLLVEAQLVGQLGEQAGARHVDCLEHPAVALGGGSQQAALHPAFDVQRRQAAMRAQELVECGHVNCSMGLRGS